MADILSRLPSEPGTYVLRLHLEPSRQLSIGKLGDFAFPDGHYLYVGSAFGCGGLRGRLKHHLRPVRKPHWHIDYLRQAAPLRSIWYTASEIVYEHTWADTLLSMAHSSMIASGFGASDCHCVTHLIYFPEMPDFAVFRLKTDALLVRINLSASGDECPE